MFLLLAEYLFAMRETKELGEWGDGMVRKLMKFSSRKRDLKKHARNANDTVRWNKQSVGKSVEYNGIYEWGAELFDTDRYSWQERKNVGEGEISEGWERNVAAIGSIWPINFTYVTMKSTTPHFIVVSFVVL